MIVVTSQLAGLDIDIIEVGFPTSLPDDLDAVRSIAIEVGNMPVGKDGHVPVICTLLRFNKRGIGAAWKAMHPHAATVGFWGPRVEMVLCPQSWMC
jgi:2-isopropylmalate synthase